MRGLAAAQGRTLRFGLRIHTLSRDTSEEAWRARPVAARRARPGHRGPGPGRARGERVHRAAADAVAARRPLVVRLGARAGGRARACGPASGLVRGGAGTALVGSHAEVADRLEEYHRARDRRVHPLGLPARRGGVLVRRGRDARAARAAGCYGDPPTGAGASRPAPDAGRSSAPPASRLLCGTLGVWTTSPGERSR